MFYFNFFLDKFRSLNYIVVRQNIKLINVPQREKCVNAPFLIAEYPLFKKDLHDPFLLPLALLTLIELKLFITEKMYFIT